MGLYGNLTRPVLPLFCHPGQAQKCQLATWYLLHLQDLDDPKPNWLYHLRRNYVYGRLGEQLLRRQLRWFRRLLWLAFRVRRLDQHGPDRRRYHVRLDLHPMRLLLHPSSLLRLEGTRDGNRKRRKSRQCPIQPKSAKCAACRCRLPVTPITKLYKV